MSGIAGAVGSIGSAVIGSAASSSSSGGSRSADRAQARQLNIQSDITEMQREHWKKFFRPVEEKLGTDALGYGSQKEQDEAAADAGAKVAQAYEGQQAALDRNMEASGNNPADPNYQSGKASIALAAGPTIGGAQYWAAKGVRDDAYNKTMGVAQLGKGIPGQVMQSANSAAQAWGQRSNALNDQANQQAANAAAGFKGIWDAGVKAFSNPKAPWNVPSTPTTVPTSDGWVVPLKTGGIVEEPTVAMMAEEGPEAVLNAGAVRMLGRDKINRLNKMGRMIAERGVQTTRRPASLGEH